MNRRNLIHGWDNTPTYHSWEAMKQRCLNPKHMAYSRYGGRGITIIPKWFQFLGFLEDMGLRPYKKCLDRIDNSKGYSRVNCRWATYKESAQNRRKRGFYE